MKFGKRKLAVAFGAMLGVGMVGQANADVYGLAYLDIDQLKIVTVPPNIASTYTFSTNQDAVLNNIADPAAGNASCNGNVSLGTTNCSFPAPTLSGAAQNAPGASGGAPVRGEGNYTAYGPNDKNYSTTEAEVIDAALTGDPATHVELISESNLADDGGQSAQATTNILSNTRLNLAGGGGSLNLSFNAIIDVKAEVTDYLTGESGLAQSATSATMTLVKNGVTLVSWSPTGTGVVSICGVGLTCTVVKDPLALNYTATSDGALNELSSGGIAKAYEINITGLVDGTYTIALATTTGTDLVRDVPVPGTLLLMGTGLLLGARATRRSKS